MTTATPLKDYKRKTIKSGAILGHLLWYMVSETSIKWTDLEAALKAEGLDDFVPRKPRDEDVFRRVAPNGHRKKISTTNDAIHVNYMIRQVKRGGGACTKHIVAETVDSSGERLDYEEVWSLVFDGTNFWHEAIGVGDATAGDMACEIADAFDKHRGKVDSAAVRAIVRAILEEARAVTVRPTGGVYFVMPAHAELVLKLEKVAERLPGAFVHPLPLIDDGKQRAMLRQAYESETIGEVDEKLAEISQLLKDKDARVTPTQYARLSARFTELMSKQAEYSGLLEDSLGTAESKLTILRKQMSALLRRVE